MNLSPKDSLVRHVQRNKNNPHFVTLDQLIQRIRIDCDIKLCIWRPLRDIKGSTHDDHLVNLVIVQFRSGESDGSDIGTRTGDDDRDFFPLRESDEVVDDGSDGGPVSFGVGLGLCVPVLYGWVVQGGEVEDAVEA